MSPYYLCFHASTHVYHVSESAQQRQKDLVEQPGYREKSDEFLCRASAEGYLFRAAFHSGDLAENGFTGKDAIGSVAIIPLKENSLFRLPHHPVHNYRVIDRIKHSNDIADPDLACPYLGDADDIAIANKGRHAVAPGLEAKGGPFVEHSVHDSAQIATGEIEFILRGDCHFSDIVVINGVDWFPGSGAPSAGLWVWVLTSNWVSVIGIESVYSFLPVFYFPGFFFRLEDSCSFSLGVGDYAMIFHRGIQSAILHP